MLVILTPVRPLDEGEMPSEFRAELGINSLVWPNRLKLIMLDYHNVVN